MREFFAKGWEVFEPEPLVEDWKHHALQDARRALKDPELAHWYECENTWFVGLDALDNDDHGRIAGSMPLSGQAIEFVAMLCGGQLPDLHRAQLSGVFPGYPKPRAGETEAAFRYPAFTALKGLDHPTASDMLVRLFDAASLETRYGAFDALRGRGDATAHLTPQPIGNVVDFYELESSSTPAIILSSTLR